MNPRLIGFSTLVTAGLGLLMGLALALITPNHYVGQPYQHLYVKFSLTGAMLGAAVGAGQEVVRELKARQDLDQAKTSFFHKH